MVESAADRKNKVRSSEAFIYISKAELEILFTCTECSSAEANGDMIDMPESTPIDS